MNNKYFLDKKLDIFRKSFEKSPNSMIIVEYKNKVARIVNVNKSFTQYYGYEKEEVLGNNPKILKSGKHDTQYYKKMWKTILDPKIGYWRDEIMNFRKNRSPIYVILTIYTIFDEQKIPRYFVANHVDITERKKAESQVKELNELLKLLNKMLYHDISNDLTVIKGGIRLYQQGIDKKGISYSLRALERCEKTIINMHQLESSLTSGGSLKPYKIEGVINEVKLGFPNLKITVNGKATVLADEAINSVIENLLRNAHVHGQTNKVDVNIKEKDKIIELRIADYGIGIPDNIKKKLFTEGFVYGKTGNHGLGLYITKKTIERYNGKIRIEDNKPSGAIFVLQLPKFLLQT